VKVDERVIAPGVVHKKIINSTDTLSIDILKVDLTNENYILRSVKAKGILNARETTSKISREFTDSGYTVLAALNADFFEVDGEIVNNMISEGEFVRAVKFTDSPFNKFVNSQLAVTYDNDLLIEQFVFSGNIIFPDGTIESLSRINSDADSNTITLYNRYQGNYTPGSRSDSTIVETILLPVGENKDTLLFLIGSPFEQGGNTEIPSDGFVLSANNKFAHYLKRALAVDDTIKLLLNLNPRFPGIRTLIGGWPILVKDGLNVAESNPYIEGVIPRFSENRHPRTGIGFSEDSSTVCFITVDGRQEKSRGMTLFEFANLMIQEGLYQALNLDGGGSTTMVINNKIVNSPSDITGEREVGNCLLLIKED
jgi:hypothetical protein